MADAKVIWRPRQWHFRMTGTNNMEAFEGAGWIPAKNCITGAPPRKTRYTFPASVASNHTTSTAFNFLTVATSTENYIITHYAPGNVGNQTVAKIVPPATYAAFTGLSNIVPWTHPSLVVTAGGTVAYMTTFSHGLIKLNMGAVTMAQVAGATTMKKVVRHLSRLIGITTDNNSSRVQWSVAGNFDDWAGAGSGSNDFILDNGTLEDIFVVNNVVVVLGSNCIHHGYPTGLGTTPYRWEEVANNTDVMAPSTHADRDANTIYYSGLAGIYKYENGTQTRLDNEQLSILIGTEINFGYNVYVYHRIREREYNPVNDRVVEAKHLACYPTTPLLAPILYQLDTGLWWPYATKDRMISAVESLNDAFGTVVKTFARNQLTTRPIYHVEANKVLTFTNDDTVDEEQQRIIISPDICVQAEGQEAQEFTMEKIIVRWAYKTGLWNALGGEGNIVVQVGIKCTHRENTIGSGTINASLYYTGDLEMREGVIHMLDKHLTGQFFKIILNFGYSRRILDVYEVEAYFIRGGNVLSTTV